MSIFGQVFSEKYFWTSIFGWVFSEEYFHQSSFLMSFFLRFFFIEFFCWVLFNKSFPMRFSIDFFSDKYFPTSIFLWVFPKFFDQFFSTSFFKRVFQHAVFTSYWQYFELFFGCSREITLVWFFGCFAVCMLPEWLVTPQKVFPYSLFAHRNYGSKYGEILFKTQIESGGGG